ncbi:MAG: hypothetical protein KDD82_14235 [Planctomycetes bacterium]|nr:hypothetical protein [Planctomycetota bacterium]
MFALIQALRLEGACARARAQVPGSFGRLGDPAAETSWVPGTLLLELMAQTAGPLLEELHAEPRWAVLGLVRAARFPAPTPLPAEGVTLEVLAEQLRWEHGSGVARAWVEVAGELRAQAELVFSLQPPAPGWEAAIAARDARVARWLAAWEGA